MTGMPALVVEKFDTVLKDAVRKIRCLSTGTGDLEKGLETWTVDMTDLMTPYLIFKGQVNPNFATERALRIALAQPQLGVGAEKAAEKAKEIIEARERPDGVFADLEGLTSSLARDEPKFKKNWVGQIFTLQTVLVRVDVEGRTKAGTTYRISAVVERYHPANESHRWQARFLYWREWPGPGSPAAEDEKDGG